MRSKTGQKDQRLNQRKTSSKAFLRAQALGTTHTRGRRAYTAGISEEDDGSIRPSESGGHFQNNRKTPDFCYS